MFVVLRDFPLLVLAFQVFLFYGSKAKVFLSLPSSNKTNDSKTYLLLLENSVHSHISIITTDLNICISFQKEIYFCDNYHRLYIAFLRRKRFYCSSMRQICSNTLFFKELLFIWQHFTINFILSQKGLF